MSVQDLIPYTMSERLSRLEDEKEVELVHTESDSGVSAGPPTSGVGSDLQTVVEVSTAEGRTQSASERGSRQSLCSEPSKTDANTAL